METDNTYLEIIGKFLSGDGWRSFVLTSGVVVAIVSVITARMLARKKQTADLLFGSRGDEKLQRGLRCIQQHYDSSTSNIRRLAAKEMTDDPEVAAVKYVLNHFESVSVGVQAGIYDETMLKECWYGIVRDIFRQSKPLIDAIQDQYGNTVYQEFEWMAKRWEAKPLKVKKKR